MFIIPPTPAFDVTFGEVRRITLRQVPFVLAPVSARQTCMCDGGGDRTCDVRECVVTLDAELLCRACVAAPFVAEDMR